MAILFIKEIGQVTVKESKDEISMELKTENPTWVEYTVKETHYGEKFRVIDKTEKLTTIRTSYIISIE